MDLEDVSGGGIEVKDGDLQVDAGNGLSLTAGRIDLEHDHGIEENEDGEIYVYTEDFVGEGLEVTGDGNNFTLDHGAFFDLRIIEEVELKGDGDKESVVVDGSGSVLVTPQVKYVEDDMEDQSRVEWYVSEDGDGNTEVWIEHLGRSNEDESVEVHVEVYRVKWDGWLWGWGRM